MKKIAAGFIVGLILTCTTRAFADNVNVDFGIVKLVLDGKKVNAQTMLYNGTTYVPLRTISESFGHTVAYDANSKTIFINTNGN